LARVHIDGFPPTRSRGFFFSDGKKEENHPVKGKGRKVSFLFVFGSRIICLKNTNPPFQSEFLSDLFSHLKMREFEKNGQVVYVACATRKISII
jgi:hypothetical protein